MTHVWEKYARREETGAAGVDVGGIFFRGKTPITRRRIWETRKEVLFEMMITHMLHGAGIFTNIYPKNDPVL